MKKIKRKKFNRGEVQLPDDAIVYEITEPGSIPYVYYGIIGGEDERAEDPVEVTPFRKDAISKEGVEDPHELLEILLRSGAEVRSVKGTGDKLKAMDAELRIPLGYGWVTVNFEDIGSRKFSVVLSKHLEEQNE